MWPKARKRSLCRTAIFKSFNHRQINNGIRMKQKNWQGYDGRKRMVTHSLEVKKWDS